MKALFLNITNKLKHLILGRGWRGAIFYICVGAFTSLAFAPLNLFPIIFLCLPILVKSLDYAETGSRAFYVGGWFAFGMFAAGLYWVGYSFLAQTDVPQWTAPIAVVALAVALSVFVALSFVVAHKFGRFGQLGRQIGRAHV